MSAPRLHFEAAAVEAVLGASERLRHRRNIRAALALNRQDEFGGTEFSLKNVCSRLEIESVARDIHRWDRDPSPDEKASLFVEQCLADTEAVLHRLFEQVASIDIIDLRILAPSCEHAIIAGTVLRRSSTD